MLNQLSYITLSNLRENLLHEISLEALALQMLKYSDTKLQRLQTDLSLVEKAIAEKEIIIKMELQK